MAVRRAAALLVILVLAALLSGCWSRKEIENLAMVTVIGFDKVEVEGREQWRISTHIIRTFQMGQAGGQSPGGVKGDATWLVTGLGDTLIEAGRNISTRSPRRIFLPHANVLVVGERLAREGVDQVIDFWLRDARIRLRPWVLIAKGEALAVLRAEPELDQLLSQELMGIITNSNPIISKAYQVTVRDFANQLAATGRDAVAAKVEVFFPQEEPPAGGGGMGGGGPQGVAPQIPSVRLTGAAVFRGDRLAGWLGDEGTRGFLYVINEAKGGVIPLTMPGHGHGHMVKDISFLMTRSRSKITPEVQAGLVTFSIDIQAEGDLGEHEENIPIARPETIKILEEELSSEIKRIVEKAVRVAQEEFRADIFGLGQVLRKKYPQVWKTLEPDWPDLFPFVEVTVKVAARIRRTGMIGDVPAIK